MEQKEIAQRLGLMTTRWDDHCLHFIGHSFWCIHWPLFFFRNHFCLFCLCSLLFSLFVSSVVSQNKTKQQAGIGVHNGPLSFKYADQHRQTQIHKNPYTKEFKRETGTTSHSDFENCPQWYTGLVNDIGELLPKMKVLLDDEDFFLLVKSLDDTVARLYPGFYHHIKDTIDKEYRIYPWSCFTQVRHFL